MWKDKRGFSIAEVIIGLSLVSIGVLLIGSLSQQVSKLSNNARQSGAVIQLRTKANSLSRDVSPWIDSLRSSPITKGVFAGCLPDPAAVTSGSSVFKCPPVNSDLLTNDPELKKIAGSLHASSVALVDNMGEKIAGSQDKPLYLDNDGRTCTQANPATKCPLKGTGYLLREKASTTANPGSVKLVVKIERNSSSTTAMNSAPMKPHYINVDVGTQWNSMSEGCPNGTIKIGYLSNGSPQCINPTAKCPSGKINTGIEADGKPRCQNPPTDCADKSIVLDLNGDLICGNTNDSPCEERQIFLGYFAGTGEAMCSSPDVQCNSGEVQVGLSTNANGSLVAHCEKLPSCSDSQNLSYDGSKFVCQNASTANNCLSGEVVVGIKADGSPKCQKINEKEVTDSFICPDGQYMKGFTPEGPICKDLAVVVPPVTPPCDPAFYIINSDPKIVADIKSQLDVFHFQYGHTTGHVGGNAGNGYRGASPMNTEEIRSYRTILKVSKQHISASSTRGWTNYVGRKWFINNVPELNEVWWFEMSNVPGKKEQLHCQDPKLTP